ncbi:Hypothetical_protein [Hexamita inflata]|uniref:Hypothetical_protein n=1 Tax=Hexamita inflata TaxID=28002 RepID=A0AA86QI87_9EUKA|nr:Hypothetical protein HINF_LOCUS25662 [Hexamita inflata]CAI9959190.1 Hypothetical protein HINF_LOCUS46835 [Hexamita inflata]
MHRKQQLQDMVDLQNDINTKTQTIQQLIQEHTHNLNEYLLFVEEAECGNQNVFRSNQKSNYAIEESRTEDQSYDVQWQTKDNILKLRKYKRSSMSTSGEASQFEIQIPAKEKSYHDEKNRDFEDMLKFCEDFLNANPDEIKSDDM